METPVFNLSVSTGVSVIGGECMGVGFICQSIPRFCGNTYPLTWVNVKREDSLAA